MNKKGFTLIELLAVIIILSLISIIATISVANIVSNSKTELSVAQKKIIKIAAESWASDNIKLLPAKDECIYLTLKDLKDEGLLDTDLKDLKTKKNLSNDLKVKITQNSSNRLNYEVDSKNANNCNYVGSSIYVSLPKGFTKVIYDENIKSWRVPKENEEWYNYNNQKWANAVVLGKNKKKRPGEKVIVEGENSDALMMYVYIPRYEYKIEGQYGTHTDGTPGTQDLPGEIEVKFIRNTQTTADEDYILHPAFTFGDQELSGIWVGKFLLSFESSEESSTNLRVLPTYNHNNEYVPYFNMYPKSVSEWFSLIRGMENVEEFNLDDVDTHMIKNSEWGAVAYLSQSKYGKYGNDDYTGKYKEIYQNNHFCDAGSSSGVPPSETNTGVTCSYDDSKKLGNDAHSYKMGQCGPGASTTGNIYGIYDMSGMKEYVMGVKVANSNNIYSGYNSSKNSGFNGLYINSGEKTDGVDVPNKKYFDSYTSDDFKTACNNDICYGQALTETAGWYNDEIIPANSDWTWFVRGVNNHSNLRIGEGIFAYDYMSDAQYNNILAGESGFTRSVCILK